MPDQPVDIATQLRTYAKHVGDDYLRKLLTGSAVEIERLRAVKSELKPLADELEVSHDFHCPRYHGGGRCECDVQSKREAIPDRIRAVAERL